MGMHVRAVLTALVAAAVTTVIAGCGGASQGGGGTTGTGGGPTGTTAIAGVFLQTNSVHPRGGTATGGVAIGLYLRPIRAGGPIAVDPPTPITTTTTDARGNFRFAGLHPGRRYFVFAMGAKGYSIGRWARPGERVRLVACTNCVMPL
jgi:hypothetical protein